VALLATKGLAALRPQGRGQAELEQAQPACNAELLRLLKLPAGAPAGAVRAALNAPGGNGDLPIHRALHDKVTGPELVRAMLDAGGEAMLTAGGFADAGHVVIASLRAEEGGAEAELTQLTLQAPVAPRHHRPAP
jgi:hypothetical protein